MGSSQYGICLMPLFWCLDFWGGSYIFWEFVDHWPNGTLWRAWALTVGQYLLFRLFTYLLSVNYISSELNITSVSRSRTLNRIPYTSVASSSYFMVWRQKNMHTCDVIMSSLVTIFFAMWTVLIDILLWRRGGLLNVTAFSDWLLIVHQKV